MDRPRLYIRPAYRGFGPKEVGKLRDALDEMTRYTLIAEPDTAADLTLDPEGRLPDGYRFTTTGLRQVCTLLGGGLFTYMRDVAGVDRGPDTSRDEYDFSAAIKAYNRTLRLRFDGRFAGAQRLLRHVKDRLVEGVLGPRYVLVENSTILERAGEAAAAQGLRFRQGVLVGRRLALRYICQDPLVSESTWNDNQPDPLHHGLHFANSEIGGESTFRAAAVLWRGRDDSYAMGPFLAGRRMHVGSKLDEKIGVAFAEAAGSTPDAAWLRRRLAYLKGRPLPLDDAGSNHDDRRKAIRALASRLHAHGIPIGIAERAVATAMAAGTGDMPTYGARPAPDQLALFGALTAAGRGLHATAQEAVEQAAYGLLAGRIKLK